MNKYTFGPVPSRRLGFSLGVDIIPRKYCTFDCIYCQVGRTTNQQIQRKSFFNPHEIANEIIEKTKRLPRVDYITFSGSGEPTLNSDIGWIIGEIKRRLDKPVSVITNASLLHDGEVRKDLERADIVLPSLDSASEDIFRYIDRPHSLIEINTIIEGMKRFRNIYKGRIWLEIMLIKDVNDDAEELERLKKISEYLEVDKIQLNTVTRPPIEEKTEGVSKETLEIIRSYFGGNCEVICKFEKKRKKGSRIKKYKWSEAVLDILKRRSLTLSDIAGITDVPLSELREGLRIMESEGQIKSFRFDENVFYIKN